MIPRGHGPGLALFAVGAFAGNLALRAWEGGATLDATVTAGGMTLAMVASYAVVVNLMAGRADPPD